MTVRGATGNPADVIIQGKGQDVEEVQVVFELTDSPRWTFKNLTTRNSYYHGFKFNTSSAGCALTNIVMRDHGESGVKGTSDPEAWSYPDDLLVENCDIGFSNPSGGTRSVVEGIDGVAVKGWVVRNCHFINIQRSGAAAYGVFTKGNSMDTVIEGNRFENCFIGASFGGGGTGPAYFRDGDRALEHRGGVIRKNTFVRCSDAAIYLNRAASFRIDENQMKGCAMNIQLRFAETRGVVGGHNTTDNENEPLVCLRDGAVQLSDPPGADGR